MKHWSCGAAGKVWIMRSKGVDGLTRNPQERTQDKRVTEEWRKDREVAMQKRTQMNAQTGVHDLSIITSSATSEARHRYCVV
jgi:hypothetical protein